MHADIADRVSPRSPTLQKTSAFAESLVRAPIPWRKPLSRAGIVDFACKLIFFITVHFLLFKPSLEKKRSQKVVLFWLATLPQDVDIFIGWFFLLNPLYSELNFFLSCHLDDYWDTCIKNEITPIAPKGGIAPPGWVPFNEHDSVDRWVQAPKFAISITETSFLQFTTARNWKIRSEVYKTASNSTSHEGWDKRTFTGHHCNVRPGRHSMPIELTFNIYSRGLIFSPFVSWNALLYAALFLIWTPKYKTTTYPRSPALQGLWTRRLFISRQ